MCYKYLLLFPVDNPFRDEPTERGKRQSIKSYYFYQYRSFVAIEMKVRKVT